ncbi:MAG: D-aminoacyl-tRNA deacylase [Myxococcota bacterium]|nr:D-aminoacyl-tRNA deacylase [Myxococcota bacterium]
MRVLLQRVSSAAVDIEGTRVAGVSAGLLLLVGVGPEDDEVVVERMAKKVCGLRIFEDEAGKMNHSVIDIGGSILAVSQFTLYGDCRRGRRPSFQGAATPEVAAPLFERFLTSLRSLGVSCESGRFQETMSVSLVNQGPVTIWLDSDQLFTRSKG